MTQPLYLPREHINSLSSYLPPHAQSSNLQSSSASIPSRSYTPPHLPHVTLTYAQSLDAQIATHPGHPTALSGPMTKAMTHWLRANHQGILVGVGTAMADNPGLRSRWKKGHGVEITAIAKDKSNAGSIGEKEDLPSLEVSKQDDYDNGGNDEHSVEKTLQNQPVPIVLDPRGRMDWSGDHDDTTSEPNTLLRLAKEGLGHAPIWLMSSRAFNNPHSLDNLYTFGQRGGKIVTFHQAADGKVEWKEVLNALRNQVGIESVMVEGGGRIIEDLLRDENQQFVQSVVITIAPVWLGKGGVSACPIREGRGTSVGRLKDVKWITMEDDVVMAGRFPK